MERMTVDAAIEKVSGLREHPANARRGDVDLIAESLAAHGQYRPIVAQRSTGYVLAGNHTLKAARRLGWRTIAVSWVDVDDETAARILVADNRASDLAAYDDDALARLLRSLPDLDGTGFDAHDLDELEGVFDAPTSSSPSTGEPGGAAPEPTAQVRVGPYHLRVDPGVWRNWRDEFAGDRKKRAIVADLQSRLGLAPPSTAVPRADERPTAGAELVEIGSISPYPANARQGDVGAISESLRVLGQYRPIVANRRDRTILVGNHTWAAARALGWTSIAVAWVDVDEVEAAKIVAVDNRASDLATYDDDALAALLTSIRDLDGVGFSPSDVDDLLRQIESGAPHRRPARTSRVPVAVGEWAWRTPRDLFDAWENGLRPEIEDGSIHSWIAHTLRLPDNEWIPEEP